jgi:hypothetical protein
MAYTLVYGSGTKTLTVQENNSTVVGGLTLPGKNFLSYGKPVDQNFLSLVENFAATTSTSGPAGALAGQLWFDTATDPANPVMKYNKSDVVGVTDWVEVAASGAGTSAVFGNVTILDTTTTNKITTGAPATAGTIEGTWTLTPGSSLHATYADLAERHHSDDKYPVGTVMTVGGINEVTAARKSDAVLGVVSDTYAYLMNSAAGDDDTHPAIAYLGRVKVRVVGPISKHDRIVNAGNGTAQSANYMSGEEFGWALRSDPRPGEKLVLCLIKN